MKRFLVVLIAMSLLVIGNVVRADDLAKKAICGNYYAYRLIMDPGRTTDINPIQLVFIVTPNEFILKGTEDGDVKIRIISVELGMVYGKKVYRVKLNNTQGGVELIDIYPAGNNTFKVIGYLNDVRNSTITYFTIKK